MQLPISLVTSPIHPVSRGPEEQEQVTATIPTGPGGWTRVHRAVVRERHVRFLLEPSMAAAEPAMDKDVEVAGPPEGPVWLCSNGRLPTGALCPRELEELEEHIMGAQARLRQALLRREELLAQLQGGAQDRPLRLLQACAEAPRTTR